MCTQDAAVPKQERKGHDSIETVTHGNKTDAARRLSDGNKPGTSEKASDRGRHVTGGDAGAQLYELFQPIPAEEEAAKMLKHLSRRTRTRQTLALRRAATT